MKLLAIAPALDHSSYARVVHATLAQLAAEWDILHLGINYYGAPVDCGWRIVPNAEPMDRYGLSTVGAIARDFRPDVVFVFDSFLDLPRYRPLVDLRKPLVAQCPVLGEASDPRLLRRFDFFDRVVVLSECVRRHFEEELPRVEVIPHGFDPALFHPVDRAAARRELGLPDDAFVVLNGNTHVPRKRIDLTLEGFAQFARGKRDVVLQLRTPGEHLDDGALNRLYNACDVGINTASGEGWGMVSFEHAASGAAQIVPGAWVFGETWGHHAELLETTPKDGRYNRENIVSAESVAAALERLHANRGYRDMMAARAMRLASEPRFHWPAIGAQWDALLRELVQSGAP